MRRVKAAVSTYIIGDTGVRDDSVGLFSFSDRLTTLQPFTKDRNAILSSLLKTRASGATALDDSMADFSRDLSKSGGKKAILLFTDGRVIMPAS